MASIPAYPNLILDTSREASAYVRLADVPFATRVDDGATWTLIHAFQLNCILVRARSRLNGAIITEFAVVRDAHKHSDREAMEEVADRLRERISEFKGESGGEVTFYEPPPQQWVRPPRYA